MTNQSMSIVEDLHLSKKLTLSYFAQLPFRRKKNYNKNIYFITWKISTKIIFTR